MNIRLIILILILLPIAVAGGFAAVACMPNTSPVNDNAGVTEYVLKKAAEARASRSAPPSWPSRSACDSSSKASVQACRARASRPA